MTDPILAQVKAHIEKELTRYTAEEDIGPLDYGAIPPDLFHNYLLLRVLERLQAMEGKL